MKEKTFKMRNFSCKNSRDVNKWTNLQCKRKGKEQQQRKNEIKNAQV
jgi:hypothetical protein